MRLDATLGQLQSRIREGTTLKYIEDLEGNPDPQDNESKALLKRYSATRAGVGAGVNVLTKYLPGALALPTADYEDDVRPYLEAKFDEYGVDAAMVAKGADVLVPTACGVIFPGALALIAIPGGAVAVGTALAAGVVGGSVVYAAVYYVPRKLLQLWVPSMEIPDPATPKDVIELAKKLVAKGE